MRTILISILIVLLAGLAFAAEPLKPGFAHTTKKSHSALRSLRKGTRMLDTLLRAGKTTYLKKIEEKDREFRAETAKKHQFSKQQYGSGSGGYEVAGSYGGSYGGDYGGSYGGSYGGDYGGSYGGSYGGDYGGSYGGGYNGDYHPNPECWHNGSFGLAMSRVDDVCERANFSFIMQVFSSTEEADKAWGKFCSSDCVSSAASFLRLPLAQKCLGWEAEQMNMILGMCHKNDAGTHYCGSEIMSSQVFQARCEEYPTHYNKTLCLANAACKWDENDRKCDMKMTEAFLDSVCTSCFRKLAGSMGMNALEYAAICKKQDGEYCTPKIMALDMENFSPDNMTNTVLDAMCDATTYACFLNWGVMMSSSSMQRAERSFEQCVENVQYWAAYYQNSNYYNYDSNGAMERCVSYFYYSALENSRMRSMFTGMCNKGPGGKYCFYYMTPAFQTTTAASCAMSVVGSGTCASACEGEVKTLAEEAGCCLSDLHTVFQITPPAPNDFPLPINQSHIPQSNGDYNIPDLSALANCSTAASAVAEGVASGCSTRGNPSNEFAVRLHLNLTAVKANSTIDAAIISKLVGDIAVACGLHPDNVVDEKLEASGEGAVFKFKIHGATALVTAAAVSALEDLIALGGLSFRGTERLIAFCRPCLPSNTLVYRTVTAASTPVDICMTEEYFRLAKQMNEACNNETETAVFQEARSVTLAQAQAGWSLMCNSKCYQYVASVRSGRFGGCLDKEMIEAVAMVAVSCTKDTENYYCGAVLSQVDELDCDRKNATTCAASTQCTWNATASSCRSTPTTSYLSTICLGGCIGRMAAALGGSQNAAKEVLLMEQMMCARENSTYFCLPNLATEVAAFDNNQFGTEEALKSVCDTPAKGRCLRRVWSGYSGLVRREAESDFFHCAEQLARSYGGRQSYDEFENMVVGYCLYRFFEKVKMADQLDAQVYGMCIKNTAGTYCMTYPIKYANAPCWTIAGSSYAGCSSSCYTELEAAVTEMGCCLGTLQQMYGEPSINDLDREEIPALNTLMKEEYMEHDEKETPSPSTTTLPPTTPVPTAAGEVAVKHPKRGLFQNLVYCSGSSTLVNIGSKLQVQCAKVNLGKVERKLPLGIAWDTLDADPKLKARLAAKLKVDLGNKFGLAKDDIDVVFVPDTSKTIVVDNGASRRMTTMGTSSGTTAEVTMNTATEEDATATGEQYDTAVEQGTMTLPSTTSTVATECTNCTSSTGGAASLQSSADLSSLFTPSGVSSFSLLTAACVAVVLSLL